MSTASTVLSTSQLLNRSHMEAGIKSTLSVPLISKDQFSGALHLTSTRPQAYAEHDLALAEQVGDQITGAITNAQLFADRKRAEEEVRILNEELETRVIERTAELEAANSELESFSYSISHDLRSPLRAMDGFSRILVDDYGPQLSEDAQRYLQIVQDNAQQMGELINDLLSFSRLGRRELRKQLIEPAELVHQAIQDLRGLQEGRQVEVSVDDLPPCQADPALSSRSSSTCWTTPLSLPEDEM